jgi:hypothetical protein
MSVSSRPYAHFQGSKGSRNRSKNSSKIMKNRWKTMSGNAMFFVIVFGTFFSQISWIWAPFWSLDGHFGVFKIASFQGTRPRWSPRGPRWSPRGLLDRFGDHFESILEGFGEIWEDFRKALGIHLEERWQETLRKWSTWILFEILIFGLNGWLCALTATKCKQNLGWSLKNAHKLKDFASISGRIKVRWKKNSHVISRVITNFD